MKRLMVDLDNCITDGLYIERINDFLNTDYKLEEQTEFKLQNLTGSRISEFFEYMEDKSFYDDAPLIDGVYEALEILNKKYELYITTAYILKKKLPFISPKQYIFIENKSLIKSDIAIDDKIVNLENADKKILINAWHNKNIKDEELNERGIVRVYTWKEILEMLDY